VDAGGAFVAPLARRTVPAGASTAGALVDHDPALGGLDATRSFASIFGVDLTTWQRQPAVRRIVCRLDCRAALVDALAASADDALIHIDGDLVLSGPLPLGSAMRPVLIVVSGAVRFDGAIALTGVLHAGGTMQWMGPAGGSVRGALIAQGGYRGDATPDFAYDPAVLDLLRRRAGSFVRVPGSWRDY
jgi:hypothetical protein